MISTKKLKNILKYSSFVEIAMNSNNLFASDKKKSGGCCNFAKGDNNEKKKQEETNQTQNQTQVQTPNPQEDPKKQQLISDCNDLIKQIKAIDSSCNETINEQDSIEKLTQLKNELTAKLAELKDKPKDENPEKPKDKEPKGKNPKDEENSKFNIETFCDKLLDFGKKQSILVKINNDEEFKKEVNKLKDEYLYFVNIFSDLDSLYEKNPDIESYMSKNDLLTYSNDYLWYSDIEKIRKDKLEEPVKIANLKAECKDLLEKIKKIDYDYKDTFQLKNSDGFWIYGCSELKSYEAYKNRLKLDLDALINSNNELKKQIEDIEKQKHEIYEKIDKGALNYFRKKLVDLCELYGKFSGNFTYRYTYGDKIEEGVVEVLDTKDITDEKGFNDNFDTFIGNVEKYYKDQVDSINKGGLLTGKFHKFKDSKKIQEFIEKDLETRGASYTVEKYRRFFDAFNNVSKILRCLRGSSNSTSLYDLGGKFCANFGTGFDSKFYHFGYNTEYNKIAELDKKKKEILLEKKIK